MEYQFKNLLVTVPKFKENKFVHVWTIDKRQEMENLIELGVDRLMTDRPSILFKVMKEKNLI